MRLRAVGALTGAPVRGRTWAARSFRQAAVDLAIVLRIGFQLIPQPMPGLFFVTSVPMIRPIQPVLDAALLLSPTRARIAKRSWVPRNIGLASDRPGGWDGRAWEEAGTLRINLPKETR
jgi:hypothetical protein